MERDLLSRAAAFFAQENVLPRVTFAFIEAETANFAISFMCDQLGVSTSGFYEWRAAQANPCRRARDNAELVETIGTSTP